MTTSKCACECFTLRCESKGRRMRLGAREGVAYASASLSFASTFCRALQHNVTVCALLLLLLLLLSSSSAAAASRLLQLAKHAQRTQHSALPCTVPPLKRDVPILMMVVVMMMMTTMKMMMMMMMKMMMIIIITTTMHDDKEGEDARALRLRSLQR